MLQGWSRRASVDDGNAGTETVPTGDGTRRTAEARRTECHLVLSRLIEAMAQPGFYPHRPRWVDVVQTHISYVFLADSEVYKVKKSVRLPFLDFSTLERRRHFCLEEVALNRRLAANVYHGVVGIAAGSSGYRLTAEDDPAAVEYAVHMRRLPADRILSTLLDRGEVTRTMIDILVDRLVDFHHHARSDDTVSANGDPARIQAVMENSFGTVDRFRGNTIHSADDDAIRSFCREFLQDQQSLMLRRQTDHRIRDCHGDLHAEHICFTDPLVVFDCIEFNERFRYCDVASEIAFLSMDLDFHRRSDLSTHLVTRYTDRSGDTALPELVPFYACYRAYVRGMVDSLTNAEAEVADAEREAALDRAHRHFALSYRYTWAYRPCVVVVSGLSGSGKSTLAEALHSRTGFLHLSSDVVRKRLAGLDPETRCQAADGAGLYSAQRTRETYAAMILGAEEALDSNRGVILDATFPRRADRDAVRALADRRGVPFLLVECRCNEGEIRRRLDERVRHGRGPSDADWDIYVQQRRRVEPFATAEGDRLVIETTQTLDGQTRAVEQALLTRDAIP